MQSNISSVPRTPFLVIWEVTRACDLACLHCRAEAVTTRHPDELTNSEGKRLLSQIADFGGGLVVLTGGDPLKRPDIFELIEHGAGLGLRMTMTPSGTPTMTRRVLERCGQSGLMRLAVSLDGSTAALHDEFRQVAGSYDWTIKTLLTARELGLPTQVNTTITRYNLGDVDAMVNCVDKLGIALWSVFFLVATGRGRSEDSVTADEVEQVFVKMYGAAQRGRFDVKSTAAPHYRRYAIQQRKRDRQSGNGEAAPRIPGTVAPDGVGRASRSINDANGFVFVSHVGEICPSGFLPLPAGNVRTDSLAEVYENSPLFVTLRDYARLKGKCGDCEYRSICGGSRARAYAVTGDYLESDPSCAYIPPAHRRRMDSFSVAE